MTYFPNRLTKPTAPNLPTETTAWEPVTRFTRASAAGRFIKCPNCGAEHRVYHFSWSALQCPSCNTMIDKSDWSYKA